VLNETLKKIVTTVWGVLGLWLNYSSELLISRNGVAGVLFRLWLKDPGFEARQQKYIFFFSKISRMSLERTHLPIPLVTGVFSGRKAVGA
jgi:hypothetical protein